MSESLSHYARRHDNDFLTIIVKNWFALFLGFHYLKQYWQIVFPNVFLEPVILG